MICDLWLVDFDLFCVFLCFKVRCVRVFSRFSSQVFSPSYRNMANSDSQGEIVPLELPDPEETQIWKDENESVHSHQHLILQLRLAITARTGCYGNGLIDVEEKPPNPERFWQRRSRVIGNSCKFITQTTKRRRRMELWSMKEIQQIVRHSVLKRDIKSRRGHFNFKKLTIYTLNISKILWHYLISRQKVKITARTSIKDINFFQ